MNEATKELTKAGQADIQHRDWLAHLTAAAWDHEHRLRALEARTVTGSVFDLLPGPPLNSFAEPLQVNERSMPPLNLDTIVRENQRP